MPDVITANRLADGVVVFQTADEGWSEDFNRAAVLAGRRRDQPQRWRAPRRTKRRNLVVDVYAVAVEIRNGHVVPKALREAIRAAGPTIRRDLGKQAEGHAPLIRPDRRPGGRTCIAMTISIRPSSPRASSSSATRSRAACPAS